MQVHTCTTKGQTPGAKATTIAAFKKQQKKCLNG